MKEACLVLDFGTSKVHTNLIEMQTGNIIQSTSAKVKWEITEENYATVPPESEFDALQDSLKKLLADDCASEYHINAIGMDFFGEHVIPLDKDYKPLYGILDPSDPRGEAYAPVLREIMGDQKFSEITGNSISGFYSPPKIMWFEKENPELFEKTEHAWCLQQYILYRMGLEPLNDLSSAGRRTLLDLSKQGWSEDLLKILNLNEEKVGKLAPSPTVVGNVQSIGEITFDYEIPVVLGAHDAASGMLGMGISPYGKDNVIGNSAGSFDLLGFFTDHVINTYPKYEGLMTGMGLVNDSYYFQLGSWSRKEMEWLTSKVLTSDDPDILTKLFAKAKFDASTKAYFSSFPSDGNGVLNNLTLLTDINEIFTAMVERITYPIARMMRDICTPINGKPFDYMRIGSSGAKSDSWVQFKADLMDINIERVQNLEISSVGVTILSGIATGYYSDFKSAIEQLVKVDKVFVPNKEVHSRYMDKIEALINKGVSF